MSELVLTYSHNIIEHLGLKLYQNKPTRVIAELVSNAWDADASEVQTNMEMMGDDRWVAILDNGHGMSRSRLSDSYLVVGHKKRKDPGERSPGNRVLMGRKGIGKLAAFGIAHTVDLLTAGKDEDGRQVHWLRFDLPSLLSQGDGEVSYRPEVVFTGDSLADIPVSADASGQVKEWVGLIEDSDGTGTLVLMRDLSIGRALNESRLLSSLGRRFTVSIRDDFQVTVNGTQISVDNALPSVDFRIPSEGFETVEIENGELRFWVGFVKRADWPQDHAGVGVYAHGKIAQDRPFFFGVKGKEIFSRYMYAVIEADWLDELPIDLISTDRTSIDWTAEETQELHVWGAKKVREWTTAFEKWRQTQEKEENRKRLQDQIKSGGPKVSAEEQEQITDLLSEITPSLGRDEPAKKEAARVLSEAWLQRPMRKLVQDLWSELGRGEGVAPEVFTRTVERLTKFSVPESLNLAVVFAQRAFALSRLHDYVHHGIEPDLQKLIEEFPWIIEPEIAVLTANEALKTAVRKAEAQGNSPFDRRSTVAGVSDAKRPDFVFLSSPDCRHILVVELKSPQEDLTIDNREQLSDYLTFFEMHYPDSELRGILVGRNPSSLKAVRSDTTIVPWMDVLTRSRARNLELLAAMLLTSAEMAGGDTRVEAAIELGGEDAERILERLAAQHQEIRELMDTFPLTAAPEAEKEQPSPADE